LGPDRARAQRVPLGPKKSDPDPAFFLIADPDPGSGSRV
jgi:hypothetical protein